MNTDALVTSFLTKDNSYYFNGVTYTVTSVFDTNNTLAEKVFRIVDSCFTQLMSEENGIILDNEYACSTAGKEDLCSQQTATKTA
ncbi:MAG: hypothetical protein PHR20_05660 [Bacteroidales bacterium]|nr:hypothetical protein [Bacteroidales bacterium]